MLIRAGAAPRISGSLLLSGGSSSGATALSSSSPGAGTGKTRVIVERVRWLLETKGDFAHAARGERLPPEPAENDAREPFAGPLLPEQILVLTYNVKAAKELSNRIEAAVGPAARARLSVSNFHSFCHRVLTESAADAGLPAQPDVLDGIGQILLLRDLRPNLQLLYYAGGSNPNYWLDQFVAFVNRAKDELVTPMTSTSMSI